MTICVVDGRGGGLGSRMVSGLRGLVEDGHAIIGLGLNSASAEAMARAGATFTETAPQMIHRRLYAADVIVGSLSLLMPGSMLGEVTPVLAQAVLESSARKVLLPPQQTEGRSRRCRGMNPRCVNRPCPAALCVSAPGDCLIEPADCTSPIAQSDHEGLKRPLGAMRGPF